MAVLVRWRWVERPPPAAMFEGTQRSLIDAPRWLLLVTLIYAPWAYGCTVRWAIDLLDILMAVIVGTWLLGCAARRQRPPLAPVLLVGVLILFGLGWGMAANAHLRHDVARPAFEPVAPLVAMLPGSVDRSASVVAMWRISGLLGILLFVADFSKRPEWRKRLWWTIAGTGTSIVFLGLLQRASGIPLLFPHMDRGHATFFGTYFYHGNAGSFINLILPAVAGLLLLSLRKAVDNLGRLLWVPATLLAVAGALLCNSRAAAAIAMLLCAALLGWGVWRGRLILARREAWIYAGVVLGVAVAAVAAIGPEATLNKWRQFGSQLNAENPRLLAASAAWQMFGDAGPFGFGPGTFALAFPHYTGFLGDAIRGVWRYAHQDYLQTAVEWGWVGATLWAVLFAGGWRGALFAAGRADLAHEDRTLSFVATVALSGVALHALVDFPLQIASLQLYVAVYLGLGWGSRHWTPSREIVETWPASGRPARDKDQPRS